MPERVDLRYRINEHDIITDVDSAWSAVAHRNDASDLDSTRVLGRRLWDFIVDDSTNHLYQQIVGRVRSGRTMRFTVRCDGPTVRRVLELTIFPADGESVEFVTRTVQSIDRAHVALLERSAPRSDEFLRACAWCARIEVSSGVWMEVEAAMEALRLFECERLPALSHGMCAACVLATSMTLADE